MAKVDPHHDFYLCKMFQKLWQHLNVEWVIFINFETNVCKSSPIIFFSSKFCVFFWNFYSFTFWANSEMKSYTFSQLILLINTCSRSLCVLLVSTKIKIKIISKSVCSTIFWLWYLHSLFVLCILNSKQCFASWSQIKFSFFNI